MNLMRRKSMDLALAEASHGTGLKKSLGALDLTLLGIGAIVGAGLFSSIKEMITGRTLGDGSLFVGAGPGVTLSFALTALACGFAALCYAEIAAMFPVAGSAYSYSYVAFGELIAWIIGWDLLVEYAIGNVYVAQSWADYLNSFLQGISEGAWGIPHWLRSDFQRATAAVSEATAVLQDSAATAAARISAQGVLDAFAAAPRLFGKVVAINLPAAGIVLLLTVMLVRGIRESVRMNMVMVLLKIALVAAFIAIGFAHVDPKNWTPFMPNGFVGVWHGAALGFFSYIGFDAVSTASEECRNPQRDLPRGMIWSLIICTVLYIATALVLTGIVPWKMLEGNDPLAQAFEVIGLTGAATAMAFGAVIAMSAVLLVFQLGQTRIFYVMARDGLLPKRFASVHPKYQTPAFNTWVTGIVVALLCSLLTPDQAIGLTNIGTLFAFVLVSLGVIALRIRDPHRHRPFKVPGYPITPLISALACLGLIFGLEASNWLRFAVWLALGVLVYFCYGIRHSRLAKPQE
ncbi:MAG: amino acid permease [Planctomycetes bacterium]|nr:amino acid permease [Planctomycetota bacterium]